MLNICWLARFYHGENGGTLTRTGDDADGAATAEIGEQCRELFAMSAHVKYR